MPTIKKGAGKAAGEDARARARSRKRSVTIAGHATSVSLEDAFWEALAEIARARGTTMTAVITEIDRARTGNLSSAIRVHVLDRLRARPPARG